MSLISNGRQYLGLVLKEITYVQQNMVLIWLYVDQVMFIWKVSFLEYLSWPSMSKTKSTSSHISIIFSLRCFLFLRKFSKKLLVRLCPDTECRVTNFVTVNTQIVLKSIQPIWRRHKHKIELFI